MCADIKRPDDNRKHAFPKRKVQIADGEEPSDKPKNTHGAMIFDFDFFHDLFFYFPAGSFIIHRRKDILIGHAPRIPAISDFFAFYHDVKIVVVSYHGIHFRKITELFFEKIMFPK